MSTRQNDERSDRRGSFPAFCLLGLPLMMAAVLGCSSVTSSRVPQDGQGFSTPDRRDLAAESGGLAYFLPLGKVHIVALLNTVLVTNYALLTEKLADGQLVTNFATKILSDTNTVTRITSTTNYLATNSTAAPAGAGPASVPASSIYSNDTATTITTEQPVVTTNYLYNVTITADYVADRSNLFILKPRLDCLHDDNVNLSIDGNGLLGTLLTSNTDQTGGVIVALAQTAIQSFELAASGGIGGLGAVPAPENNADFATVKVTDDDDWTHLATGLLAMNRSLGLGLTATDRSNLSEALRKAADKAPGSAEFTSLKQAVADALNSVIINRTQLDLDDFRAAGVCVRPETEWLANSLNPSDRENYVLRERLLNRMLLEDAFPGEMERVRSPWPLLPPTHPQMIDISFNPFIPEEMAAAQAALKAGGLSIQNAQTFAKTPDSYTQLYGLTQQKTGGVYYRPPMPYEVRIADRQANVISRSVLLPNKSPILHIDFEKAPFVTTVSQLTMTNGFITSYVINKPSSALAIASMPLTIVSDLTSSLTNLLQLKLNLATGQTPLSSAALVQQSNQIASLTNSMTLLQLQQQLNQALSAAKTNSASTKQ